MSIYCDECGKEATDSGLCQLHWDKLNAQADERIAKLEAALRAIAALQAEEPRDATDAIVDGAWYSSGNEDDVFDDGRRYGKWLAAEIARKALIAPDL